MKILMLNTFDAGGGAARAAARLQQGGREIGLDISLLVQFESGDTPGVICNPGQWRKQARRLKLFLGLLPVRIYPNKPENNFSPALLPERVPAEITSLAPDIIHLHWLAAGFISVETIGRLRNKPLVWTLHDSWAFTGGCHVPFDCTRYRQSCGTCPVLGSSRESDLSRWTWKRKKRAWRNLDLTLVSPSRWLADCARSSSLFRDCRVEVIPNGLDTETFKPVDRTDARRMLGLPSDKRIILFGAVGGGSDPNKGFRCLQQALQIIDRERSDTLALSFGSSDPGAKQGLEMPVVALGPIHDDRKLAAVYAAADVMVVPSLLENLPNTILEAMASGTPCVAFRQGGVPELVEHEVTGYLARPYSSEELAKGIAWVVDEPGRRAQLAQRARKKIVAEFSQKLMARRYAELYRELLLRTGGSDHG